MSTHAFCHWRGLLCLLVLVPILGCGGNPAAPDNLLNIDQLGDGDDGTNVVSGDSATSTGGSDSGSPSAHISASTTVGVAPLTIHFNGSGSSGPARIVEYAWDFGDGAAASAVEVFHTFAAPGVYSVQLTVRDVQGATGVATLDISVLPGIRIVATPASASGVCPLQMRFGVAMIGTVGRMPVDVAYHWKFGDGTEGNGPNVVKVYNKPGRYTVTLAAVIGSLVLPGDQLVVTVRDPSVSNNQPPIANAGPDQTVVDANGDGRASVLLDASGSRDPDGHIVWYQWTENVGSGGLQMLAESSAPKMEVQLPVGRHEITLTVADDQQATGQDIVVVSVVARAALSITPTEGFSSSGQVGGVFSPQQAVYTLKNGGQQALEWTASCGQNWLDIVPASGVLAGGQTVQVTVSIGSTPVALGVGTHLDAVNFTNRTNGIGSTSRVVRLTVTDPALPTIAGRITEDGVGVPDVVMEGLPGEPKTDDQGCYSAQVPLGWSGLVLPTKVDYTFDPPSRRYSNVTADAPDQDYVATAVEPQFADHVSQYGITWTFDKPYRVGQFVNGDWWVIGPVVIESVDPAWDGVKNGSMIDPLPEGDQVPYQGLDSRAAGYAPTLRQVFPVTVDPAPGPRSLISAIGRATQAPGGAHQALSDAAVLTVLAQVPPANAFRPPWCGGGGKPLWTTGHINWGRLPGVPLPPGVTLPYDYSKVSRPWIDFGPYGQTGAEIHPENNMPPYPREMVAAFGRCSLACLVESNPNREQWALALVQIGIDLYEVSKSNEHGWRAYGGFGMGRKWPIMFAGMLLECPEMRSPSPLIVPGKGVNTWKFAEDGHSFIGEPTPTYPEGAPMFGWNCAENGYAYPDFFGNHDCRDPNGEFECEPFGQGEFSDIKRMLPEYGWPGANPGGYRKLNVMVWTFEALPCLMMGGREYWNHDAFFALVDRCVAEQWGGPEYLGFYGKDRFVRLMWMAYRGNH